MGSINRCIVRAIRVHVPLIIIPLLTLLTRCVLINNSRTLGSWQGDPLS